MVNIEIFLKKLKENFEVHMSAQQKGLPEGHWIILNHFKWTITIETKMLTGFNQMIALKYNYFNCS